MTNEFYKLLLNEKWVWKKWNGPKQLEDKKTHSLMMLPTDYVLTQDKSFMKWVKAYADSEELWFKEYVCSPVVSACRKLTFGVASCSFSDAVSRLFELGVPTQQFVSSEPWIMKSSDEQGN